jgi:hypothetical protein
LIGDQGECAFIFSYDSSTDTLQIDAYTHKLSDYTPEDLSLLYLQAYELFPPSDSSPVSTFTSTLTNPATPSYFVFDPKKRPYKPVAKKARPQLAELPDKFRIKREIIGDPLASMPPLSPNPDPFVPTGRYTEERKKKIDEAHPPGFLWEQERALMHDFMCKQNEGFAWTDSERGHFRTDFFPPIEFPVIPHKPWVEKNIPIPPGVYKQVCEAIKTKLAAGVYEPSNSSYRSRWFCVYKKDGKSLRPVHSLESLNKVTIQHSGVPPFPEHVAEQFAGRSCGAMLDLFVGYDERLIAESSRDYTTFQTPFGALRLVTLPMGWTNSVPIFHDDTTFILQEETPHITVPFIDDVPVKGPKSQYIDELGNFETIPQNPGIRRFVWEHFENLNRIVQRMKYCGGTFSGHKAFLCTEEIVVLGHRCTPLGRIPDKSRLDAIAKWKKCSNRSEVRAFLGTIGVARIFIKDFAKLAHHLNKLTRQDVPFEWGPDQVRSMETLKTALFNSPALRPIDYESSSPVILAVDTSIYAIGYYLAQCDPDNPKRRHFNRFCSITLNDRETRFSQPKLEIYGLYRALRALRLYLVGVRNLIVEVDARYIKGMLKNPDIAPNATINRWIIAILLFQFTLVHVPGHRHGPDGLSRRLRQDEDEAEDEADQEDFEDWVDHMHGFVHMINDYYPIPFSSQNALSTFVQTHLDNEDNSGVYNTLLAFTQSSEDSEDDDDDLDEEVEADIQEEEVEEEEDDDEEVIPQELPPDMDDVNYSDIPRPVKAKREEQRLRFTKQWLSDLQRPPHLSDKEYTKFMRYCMNFFIDGPRLWRKDSQGAHKLVISSDKRIAIMRAAHDDIGHKGFFATRSLIMQRFWWPHMQFDISWFVRTCYLCQTRQTTQLLLPPSVATPAPIFSRMFADTMFMPASGGFRYIVQGRCSLIAWPEFRKLRSENANTIGDWIFEDVLCRWGSLREIITDNGKPFIKALEYLADKYGIYHIRLSGYNHRANGIVERSHFDVRQSLYKVAGGNQNKWAPAAHSVFWAERVTVKKRMGCSPYFAATGAHPLLPLDFIEATYLMPPPDSILSTTDLITRRAITLQKRSEDLARIYSDVFTARRDAATRFEKEHKASIKNYDFQPGDLVLQRNSSIEMSLNTKMQPRYTGPLIVIKRNKGGAYILCELDGSVLHRPVAAFRVIPYLSRKSIPLPDNILDILDIDAEHLRQLEETDDIDD